MSLFEQYPKSNNENAHDFTEKDFDPKLWVTWIGKEYDQADLPHEIKTQKVQKLASPRLLFL